MTLEGGKTVGNRKGLMDYQLWVDYHLLWGTFHCLLLPFSSLIQAIWHPWKLKCNLYSYFNHLQQPWKKHKRHKTTGRIQGRCGSLCLWGNLTLVSSTRESLHVCIGRGLPAHTDPHMHPGLLTRFALTPDEPRHCQFLALRFCSCLHNLIKTFLLVIPV